MKQKTEKLFLTEKHYKILLRDFLIINGCSGVVGFGMFITMLLEKQGLFPSLPCVIHDVLHLYCPGCGGTRAIFEMLQGHFLTSLLCNPVILLGVLLILYYEISVIVTLVKRNGKCYYYRKGTIVYIYIIIVGIFTILRNILLVAYHIDYMGDFY